MAYEYFSYGNGVLIAVVDCIARDGIHNVSIEVVAREMRRSRSALYQRFRSWRGMLIEVHEEILQTFNGHVHHWRDDRRLVFDSWWNALAHELRTPLGTGFRALRGLVADQGGCEMLAIREVQLMPSLIRWVSEGNLVGNPTIVAHRLWLLMLGSLPFEPGSQAEDEFRQLAWQELTKVRSADRPVSATQ